VGHNCDGSICGRTLTTRMYQSNLANITKIICHYHLSPAGDL